MATPAYFQFTVDIENERGRIRTYSSKEPDLQSGATLQTSPLSQNTTAAWLLARQEAVNSSCVATPAYFQFIVDIENERGRIRTYSSKEPDLQSGATLQTSPLSQKTTVQHTPQLSWVRSLLMRGNTSLFSSNLILDIENGGYRGRTDDLLLAKQMLSQLS